MVCYKICREFYYAIDKTLYINSKIGDNFQIFFSGPSGFGIVGLKNVKRYVNMVMDFIDINKYSFEAKRLITRSSWPLPKE